MPNKTQIVLGFAALALGLVVVNASSSVLAVGQNYSEARHTTNVTAFQNGDYKAWNANMAGRGAARFVNANNFNEYFKAQVASQKGDQTLLNAFRAKYGMGQGKGMGNGQGCHNQ